MKEIWVLTEEFNDYDQHGEYFLAVFEREPTEEDLKEYDYSYFGRKHQWRDYSWVNKRKVKVRS